MYLLRISCCQPQIYYLLTRGLEDIAFVKLPHYLAKTYYFKISLERSKNFSVQGFICSSTVIAVIYYTTLSHLLNYCLRKHVYTNMCMQVCIYRWLLILKRELTKGICLINLDFCIKIKLLPLQVLNRT